MSKQRALLGLSLLLTVLSGCSQRCDCEPARANQAAQPQTECLMKEMQQDDSAQPVNQLPDRTMAEATTSVQAEPLSDQLEQLIAEEGEKNSKDGLLTLWLSRRSQLPPRRSCSGAHFPLNRCTMLTPQWRHRCIRMLVNSRKQLTDYALQLAFKLAGDMQFCHRH